MTTGRGKHDDPADARVGARERITRAGDLDHGAVRESFDRASAAYEATAVLQARVNDELLERVAFFGLEPEVVLDLGAGTGRGTRALAQQYPEARVIAVDIAPGMLREARAKLSPEARFDCVCGDAFALPMRAASADIVFSNLMLQWCDDLDRSLAEVRRVLRPGGLFAFTTFGPDTLIELRTAWAAVDAEHSHVNTFLDVHDVGNAVMRAGLSEPVLDVERRLLTYVDALAVMRDLKSIGAHNVTASRPRGLTGRARWRRMIGAYEAMREEGRIPATYEVIYGAAWGAAPRPGLRTAGGEVLISPSAIRHRS
jgi:malonyl-CoA O-methyltransferase